MAPLDQGNLSRRGWLAGKSPAFRRCVLEEGRRRHVSAGEVIALEGDTDTMIFGIAAGAIAAQRSHRHEVPILGSILFPGQWFGSGPRLAQRPRMMTFAARVDSTLLCLGDAELERVRAGFPDLANYLAQLAQLQANHAVDCLSELLIPETELRIAAVLLRLANLAAPDTILPLAQTELAEMANASRASVAKLIKELKQRGLVAISYGRIMVCDRVALTAWFDNRMAAA
jgi:CRP-like cAMP-binding protein